MGVVARLAIMRLELAVPRYLELPSELRAESDAWLVRVSAGLAAAGLHVDDDREMPLVLVDLIEWVGESYWVRGPAQGFPVDGGELRRVWAVPSEPPPVGLLPYADVTASELGAVAGLDPAHPVVQAFSDY